MLRHFLSISIGHLRRLPALAVSRKANLRKKSPEQFICEAQDFSFEVMLQIMKTIPTRPPPFAQTRPLAKVRKVVA